jgi:hypothetical protein
MCADTQWNHTCSFINISSSLDPSLQIGNLFSLHFWGKVARLYKLLWQRKCSQQERASLTGLSQQAGRAIGTFEMADQTDSQTQGRSQVPQSGSTGQSQHSSRSTNVAQRADQGASRTRGGSQASHSCSVQGQTVQGLQNLQVSAPSPAIQRIITVRTRAVLSIAPKSRRGLQTRPGEVSGGSCQKA